MVILDKKKNIQNIKLIDFGLSCYYIDLKTSTKNLDRCGTLNYTAPEILDR